MRRWGQGHRAEQLKAGKVSMPWQWCPRCGLVSLRNRATSLAMRKKCEADNA